MAGGDNALLSALISGDWSPGGTTAIGGSSPDLNAFQKTLVANDPWTMAAEPVLSAKFNTSTWTPNQTTATLLGQAFLGSALKALGQQSISDQIAKTAAVLPALYENPARVALPEGVDPTAFGALKMGTMARKFQTDEAIRQAVSIFQGEGRDQPKQAKLTPQAVQKLSVGQGLLSQIDQAINLVDNFHKNPDLGVVGKIPFVGDLASKLFGTVERNAASLDNTTPESIYNTLMQSVYEGTGKYISNSARQRVIDENKRLTDAGVFGSPDGIKIALRNIQDIIKNDVLDSASGYNEQDYRAILDAVNAARNSPGTSGGSGGLAIPPELGGGTVPTAGQKYEIKTGPDGKKYKVALGK